MLETTSLIEDIKRTQEDENKFFQERKKRRAQIKENLQGLIAEFD